MFAQQFSTGKPEALCRHVMRPGLPCRENQARLAPVTPPGRAPPVPFRLRADVLTPEKPSRSTGHCGVCPASPVSPPRPASVAAPGPDLHSSAHPGANFVLTAPFLQLPLCHLYSVPQCLGLGAQFHSVLGNHAIFRGEGDPRREPSHISVPLLRQHLPPHCARVPEVLTWGSRGLRPYSHISASTMITTFKLPSIL